MAGIEFVISLNDALYGKSSISTLLTTLPFSQLITYKFDPIPGDPTPYPPGIAATYKSSFIDLSPAPSFGILNTLADPQVSPKNL